MLGRDFVSMLSPARIRWRKIFDEESRMMLSARKVPMRRKFLIGLALSELAPTDGRTEIRHSCGYAYWQRFHAFARYIPTRHIYSPMIRLSTRRLSVSSCHWPLSRRCGNKPSRYRDIVHTSWRSLAALISILLSKRSSIINGSALLLAREAFVSLRKPTSRKPVVLIIWRWCKWNKDRVN